MLTCGCPPPDARSNPPASATRVGPKSISMFPFEAVSSPDLALAPWRTLEAAEVAFSSPGRSAPAVPVTDSAVASNEALGRSAPTSDRRTVGASLGAKAGPGGRFCVVSARRAEPDAVVEGLPGIEGDRSRFADCPTPAIPPSDCVIAIREGRACGWSPPASATFVLGVSARVDEAAI
jgi:hypothetical protein